MILKSELLYVALSVLFVLTGFALAKNKARFLLATGVMTIAWQGGFWLGPFSLDLTVTYFVFGLLFVWSFVNSNRRLRINKLALPLYFWGGVIVFSLFAVIPAIDKNYARLGFARTVLDLMVFMAIIKSLRSANDIKFFIKVLLAAFLFQGGLALIQYKFPYFKVGVIDQHQSWMWWRTKGTFYHANEMGMYSLFMIPLAVRVFFSSIIDKNRQWIWFSGIVFLVGAVALFTTANRGSWAGLAGGLVFMFGYDFFKSGRASLKLKRIIGGLAIPAIIFMLFFAIKFGPRFIDRMFYDNADDMIEGRMQYQEEAIEIIKANPVLGVGYKNYLNHVNSYFVHNMYLLSASEIGVPGLIFLVGFFGSFLVYTFRGMRSKIFFISNLSRGLFATQLGFFVASIPGPDFWISHPIQLYYWMLVVLQVALLRIEKQAQAQLKFQKMKTQKSASMPSDASQRKSLTEQLEPQNTVNENKPLWNIRIKDAPDRE